jgi:hypothetical protein
LVGRQERVGRSGQRKRDGGEVAASVKLPEVLAEVVRVVGVADHSREQVDDQVHQVEVDGFQF